MQFKESEQSSILAIFWLDYNLSGTGPAMDVNEAKSRNPRRNWARWFSKNVMEELALRWNFLTITYDVQLF